MPGLVKGGWHAHFATIAEVLYLLLGRELKWSWIFVLLYLLGLFLFQHIDRLFDQINLANGTALLLTLLTCHLLFDLLHALLWLDRRLAAKSWRARLQLLLLLALSVVLLNWLANRRRAVFILLLRQWLHATKFCSACLIGGEIRFSFEFWQVYSGCNILCSRSFHLFITHDWIIR